MNLWAALWWQRNSIDGDIEYILRENLLPKLFKTRHECKIWIKEKYGYIKNRNDLRRYPHGWRLPQPIKIIIDRLD